MHLLPFLGKQIAVQDLGQQRMREPIAARRSRPQHPRIDRLAQRREHGRLEPERGRDPDEPVITLRMPADRHDPGQLPRGRRHLTPRPDHRVPQPRRPRRRQHGRPRIEIPHEQAGQIRIPAGPHEHLIDQPLVRRAAEDTGDLLTGPGPIKTIKDQFPYAGKPLHIGQPAGQPLTLGPQRGDHREPPIRTPGDHIQQQVEGTLVRPLQIVDHQHHRPVVGRPIQPGVELHQRDTRTQPGPPQHRPQRQQRHGHRGQRKAGRPDRLDPIAGGPARLVDKCGLAHTRLAAHQQRRGPPAGGGADAGQHRSTLLDPPGQRHAPSLAPAPHRVDLVGGHPSGAEKGMTTTRGGTTMDQVTSESDTRSSPRR